MIVDRVLDGYADADGEYWLAAIGWNRRQGAGAPFLVPLPWFSVTANWDSQAFIAHFVTGLHDVFEHTFDAWNRPWKEHCEELLVTDYRVEEVARAFGLSVEDADQWLAYRTLYTRIPWSLLVFMERVFSSDARPPRVPPDDLDGALAETFGEPLPLTSVARPYRWDGDTLVFAAALHPGHNPRAARFLNLALTHDTVSWRDLFADASPTTLRFRPEGLATLRAAMTGEDVSGRIGTPEEGAHSDRSLRLLLRARVENLVAPPALWAAILDGDRSRLGEDGWRLPLPAVYGHRVEEVAA